jgi:hypothetical protein
MMLDMAEAIGTVWVSGELWGGGEERAYHLLLGSLAVVR